MSDLKVAFGCLIFMIFIFHKTCYKFVIILFHDDTIINIQYDKNKDTYNVSFSSIKHLTAKIDFIHFTRHPWQAQLQIFQNGLNKLLSRSYRGIFS